MEFLLPLLLSLPPGAGPMIGVAMSLGIFMVGAMFMVAYAMQNPQLIAIAREEMAALIFTALILAFFLGSDSFLNGLVRGMLESSLSGSFTGFLNQGQTMGGLSISHLNLALASLTIIENKLKSQYVDLYLFEALIGFLSTISFPLGSPIPAVNIISFSLAPFTGLNLLSNAHTVVVETIGYLVTVLWAKQFLLIFARDVVPILLFPLGLVLRAIPFFRRTGSSVIAICFAMYFVMPFAIILSNYMIFDIFKPADFTYNPDSASFFGTDRDATYFNDRINQGRSGTETNHLLDQFNAPDVATEASNAPTDECAGNLLVRMICSVKNLVQSAISTVGGFFSTVWAMLRFMVGMTGDFFWTMFNNPMMPQSMSSGLFFFVIQEVAVISPFIILVMLTTVIEIIITVTTYRNVSVLIGGEAELVGLSKVV